MSDGQAPSETAASGDHLIRGLAHGRSVRVVATLSTGVAREATRRHGTAGLPAAVLGRATTAGLLLATLTKDRERITAQIIGGGPLGSVMVDANGEGDVRAYLKEPHLEASALPGVRLPLGAALGRQGVVRVVRDLGLREMVRGETTLRDGEIDTDLEHYLNVSEQIASVLACDSLLGPDLDVAISGGLLLQALPGGEAVEVLDRLRERLRGGALARALAARPAPTDAEALARAALGEDASDLAVLDVRPVRFFCPCSRERAAATLALFSAEELDAMAREDDGALVTCEFCRARHVLSRAEVERIRDEVRARGRASL